jgi:hypothetical protein
MLLPLCCCLFKLINFGPRNREGRIGKRVGRKVTLLPFLFLKLNKTEYEILSARYQFPNISEWRQEGQVED